MKNIHIIPTDKPSRLFKVSDELKLTRKFDFYNGAIYQNIYITSDEQPKHNDYYTIDGKKIYYCNTLNPTRNNHYKKIILTTDQDLIKDGVQAIDDDFLDWFVKNPSCEEVEVFQEIHHFGEVVDDSYPKGFFDYKIIIPKETKQDPLEQAAKEYAEMHLDVSGNLGKYLVKAVFQDGGKWQQEQDKNKYSEEDMKQFGLYLGDNLKKLKGKTIDEIFEQFKNL